MKGTWTFLLNSFHMFPSTGWCVDSIWDFSNISSFRSIRPSPQSPSLPAEGHWLLYHERVEIWWRHLRQKLRESLKRNAALKLLIFFRIWKKDIGVKCRVGLVTSRCVSHMFFFFDVFRWHLTRIEKDGVYRLRGSLGLNALDISTPMALFHSASVRYLPV